MSPARLPEDEKRRRGTIREDRLPEPRLLHIVKGEIDAAQAALTRAEQQAAVASATIAREGTKVKCKDRRARSKTRNHPAIAQLGRAQEATEKYRRILALLRDEEKRAEAVAAAAAAELPIRPGLENYGVREVESANPPLNNAEQLEWLAIGPRTDAEAAERRKAAGLPPSPPSLSLYGIFIDRLRENAAAGFSTKQSRKILREYDASEASDPMKPKILIASSPLLKDHEANLAEHEEKG